MRDDPQVDPEKGTWADIDRLAKKYDLMVEFMVNHISPASQEFQDFLAKGPDSEYWPMFIHWNDFWEGGALVPWCPEGQMNRYAHNMNALLLHPRLNAVMWRLPCQRH